MVHLVTLGLNLTLGKPVVNFLVYLMNYSRLFGLFEITRRNSSPVLTVSISV
jgi:hypothetical protein